MSKNEIYLDYAAATPMAEQVFAVVNKTMQDNFHNPSALYQPSRQAREQINQYRSKIAQKLQVKPNELIFTAGASEANNIAIIGSLQKYSNPVMLTTKAEHDSIYNLQEIFETRFVSLKPNGDIDLSDFQAKLVGANLVSLSYVNNETGVVANLRKIKQILKQYNQDLPQKEQILLHCDASQATQYFALTPHRLGVDFLTINGAKIHGPKQSAILYFAHQHKPKPILFGGGQESNLRPGTENLANIAGISIALDMIDVKANYEKVLVLRDYFEAQLQEFKTTVVAQSAERSPHISNVIFHGQDNERLAFALSQAGIYVGIGSACHASKLTPSRVLKELGYSDQDIHASIRFSFDPKTTKSELSKTIDQLKKLIS